MVVSDRLREKNAPDKTEEINLQHLMHRMPYYKLQVHLVINGLSSAKCIQQHTATNISNTRDIPC